MTWANPPQPHPTWTNLVYLLAILFIKRIIGDVNFTDRLEDPTRLPVNTSCRVYNGTELTIVSINAISAEKSNNSIDREYVHVQAILCCHALLGHIAGVESRTPSWLMSWYPKIWKTDLLSGHVILGRQAFANSLFTFDVVIKVSHHRLFYLVFMFKLWQLPGSTINPTGAIIGMVIQ